MSHLLPDIETSLPQSSYFQEYRKRNKEKLRSLQINWIKNNYERMMLHSAKARALKQGFEFNIDVSDIIIPNICPYLNIPITKIIGQGNIMTNASLDRIDNSKGYVKGNVEVISNLANKMKHSASKEQLITFAKNILNRYEDFKLNTRTIPDL